MDMDGDWPLPRPNALFKLARTNTPSLSRSSSIAHSFSLMAKPVVAEAVQRARELSTHGDEEGFHQLRVAFRKLRALYWAYSPYLGAETTTQAIDRFKRLADVAGGTRDWDIAGQLMRVAQESDASIELMLNAAREKRAQAVAVSQSIIRTADVEVFLNHALLDAETTLRSRCDDLPVRAFAEERVRLARRAVKKRCKRASRREASLEEDLHDVRKAGKKLRYLLEFFEPVIKGGHRRAIKRLASAQDELGKFNDIAASENLIRETSFEAVPPEAVQASLQWLGEQKDLKIRSAARRVRRIAD